MKSPIPNGRVIRRNKPATKLVIHCNEPNEITAPKTAEMPKIDSSETSNSISAIYKTKMAAPSLVRNFTAFTKSKGIFSIL